VTDPVGCATESGPVTFCVKPHCPTIVPPIDDQMITAGFIFTPIALDLHVLDAFDAVSSLTWTTSGNAQLTL